MSAFLMTAAALAVGAATLLGTASGTAPAFAATSSVPLRVVPGMPKTVDACGSGGFTVTSAPRHGTVVTNDAGFVYTTTAGTTSGADSLVGHCDAAVGKTLAYQITLAGKNPNPVRIGYAETCKGSAGTVVFTMTNADSRTHSVSITATGLAPKQRTTDVSAAAQASVESAIGAPDTKVSVQTDGGRPRLVDLKGCPAGNGATGVVPLRGSKAGGGFLAGRAERLRHFALERRGADMRGTMSRRSDPAERHPQGR